MALKIGGIEMSTFWLWQLLLQSTLKLDFGSFSLQPFATKPYYLTLKTAARRRE